MMGSVFNQAERVLAMLKISANKIGNVHCLLRHLQNVAELWSGRSILFGDEDKTYWFQSLSHLKKFPLRDLLVAMSEIGEAPYWERLWIFQEVKLAKRRIIMLGEDQIEWETLRMLYIFVQQFIRDVCLDTRDPATSRPVVNEAETTRLFGVKQQIEISKALSSEILKC